MSDLHVYRVTEDGYVTHVVTAASPEGALALVRETCEIPLVADDPVWQVELDVVQLADDAPYTLTLDATCDPEDPDVAQFLDRAGFSVELKDGRLPKVTATCRTWAASETAPLYMGCSEW